MRMLCVLIASCLLVAGCASSNDMATGSIGAGPYPTAYRQIVREYVRATFKDPYSIRDAEIAPPKPSGGPILIPPTGPLTELWIVCMRANAKNAFGAYTGLKPSAILIHNNQAVNIWEEQTYLACGGAKYEPFPEVMSNTAAR